MNELDTKDKLILDDILKEIDNLKKYNNELSINIRGEKLESYINNIQKNINTFEMNVEKVYEDNFETIETLE